MAFGDFATLQDDFNRANANPLDGSWTNKVVAANTSMLINSSQAGGSSGAGTNSAWFTGFTPGDDCEAYITINTVPSNGEFVRVYARLATPGTAGVDGYFVQWTKVSGANNDSMALFRLDNASATSIGTFTGDYSAGDKIGIECIGSAISAYHFTGGVWTQRITTTDATYSAAGPAGIGGLGNGFRLDDFFAGTVSTSTGKRQNLLTLGIG